MFSQNKSKQGDYLFKMDFLMFFNIFLVKIYLDKLITYIADTMFNFKNRFCSYRKHIKKLVILNIWRHSEFYILSFICLGKICYKKLLDFLFSFYFLIF